MTGPCEPSDGPFMRTTLAHGCRKRKFTANHTVEETVVEGRLVLYHGKVAHPNLFETKD